MPGGPDRASRRAHRWIRRDLGRGLDRLRRGRRRAVAESSLDLAWYRRQVDEDVPDRAAAVEHFARRGARDGLLLSPASTPSTLQADAEPPAVLTSLVRGDRADEVLAERLDVALQQQRIARTRLVTPSHDETRARRARQALSPSPLPDEGEGPLVSVVLPVKDRAGIVGAAVASVVAQTMPSWELLVIDDSSSDDLAGALAAWLGDTRIRLAPSHGSGVCAARNTALAMAAGRYVAYLDSDDSWRPDHLELVLAAAAAHGARSVYSDVALHSPGRPDRYRSVDGGLAELAEGNFIGLPVLLHERALLDQTGGFDASLVRCVDFDLVLRLAERAPIVHLPVVTCDYNDDPEDASRITRSRPRGDCHRLQARTLTAHARGLPGARTAATEVVIVLDLPRDTDPDAAQHTVTLMEQARAAGAAVTVVAHGFHSLARSLSVDAHALALEADALHLARPGRYGVAVATAVARSKADLVFVLPAALRPDEGLMAGLSATFDDPRVTLAQPRVLGPDGEVGPAARGGPGAAEGQSRVVDVPAVSSHVWGMRRPVVDTLGGVDAAYRTGQVTRELSRRVSAHGAGRVVVDRGVLSRVETIPAQEVAPRAFVDEDDLAFRRLRPLMPVDVAGA